LIGKLHARHDGVGHIRRWSNSFIQRAADFKRRGMQQ